MKDEISLHAILDYNMSPVQALAYKVALAWEVLARKKFPSYRIQGLRSKGDPRESYLFKCAFRLVKETNGPLTDKEYIFYVRAQLDILAGIVDKSGRCIADTSPNCLVGDKAWVRWKLWKNKFDKIAKQGKNKEEAGLDIVSFQSVCKELDKTKFFLINYFGELPKEHHIKSSHQEMKRWIALGKVSGIYALLCPWIKQYCEGLSIDLSIYKKSITQQVIDYFNKQFMT